MPGRMLILLNDTSSRVWRVYPNCAYLRDNRGWEIEKVEAGQKISSDLLQWADVVFQEMGLDAVLPKKVRKLGKAFVYDIDDLVHKPPKNHPDFDKLSRPVVRMRTIRTIHNSNVLICSNDYLRNHYKWFFPSEIQVFGNYVDLGYWEQAYHPNTTGTIRIGWCGSPSHWEDLNFIEPVIARVLKEFPNTKFVYCGMGGQRSAKRPDFEYAIGKDVFDKIPDERREFVMGVPWEDWPSRLSSLQLDIGIAPVVDNKFGRAKTPIKWMEYSLNRSAVVASKHLYGAPFINHGVDGLAVENTEEAWYDALKSLVQNETKRRTMGETAYNRIKRDFNMEDHVGRWADIIERAAIRYNPDFAARAAKS